jgi:nucleotide-binding universal stress UspA family protein
MEKTMNKILLAVDGSDHSRRAIAKAAEVAKLSGGEVHVFHYQEREPSKAGMTDTETSSDAAALVNEAVDELQDVGVKASGETRAGLYGQAARAILDEASRFGADLIVMGSRGRSDFEALLLGSVAHKVIHYGHCPVLIVR